jgi:glycosyltransferase involved in cell wall biosynthesis
MHEICVLVPNFNNEKYLYQCLQSIFAQETKASFYVYFCDDCSTDNSVKIFQEFLEGYPSLCELIQNKENSGTLFTSIQLYKKIQAKYFTVLDGDDFWKNTKFLEEAYNFLENNNSYATYAENTILLDAQTGKESLYQNLVIERKGYDKVNNVFDFSCPHTSSTVYRSNFDAHTLAYLENVCKERKASLANAILDHIYEGELFRNSYFAIQGKQYLNYKNVAGVYRVNLPNSRWSCLPEVIKNCLNAIGVLSMANLTQEKIIKIKFLDLSKPYVSVTAALKKNIYCYTDSCGFYRGFDLSIENLWQIATKISDVNDEVLHSLSL